MPAMQSWWRGSVPPRPRRPRTQQQEQPSPPEPAKRNDCEAKVDGVDLAPQDRCENMQESTVCMEVDPHCEDSLFPTRAYLIPDELKGMLLLPSEADSESTSFAEDDEIGDRTNTISPGHGTVIEVLEVLGIKQRPPTSAGAAGLFMSCLTPWATLPRVPVIDYVEVDGQPEPIAAVSAEWSRSSGADRRGGRSEPLCRRTRALFDPENADGAGVWGTAALGMIVVAEGHGIVLQDIALNAEAAGAAGVIVVKGDSGEALPEVPATRRQASMQVSPRIPTVVVPSCHRELFCDANAELFVAIVRR
mmetsp:Transcript_127866/g.368256  ORF Transcript_127866/g.368256 Transcript_127866/m.368256 type:complete len:305 (+) Transcript_127866:126-1040(+)